MYSMELITLSDRISLLNGIGLDRLIGKVNICQTNDVSLDLEPVGPLVMFEQVRPITDA